MTTPRMKCVGKREQKNDKHQALSASFEQIASKQIEKRRNFHPHGGVLRDEKKINNA